MFFSQWEFWRSLGPTGMCGTGSSLLCQEGKLYGSFTKRYTEGDFNGLTKLNRNKNSQVRGVAKHQVVEVK